jgi:hypothetical protein
MTLSLDRPSLVLRRLAPLSGVLVAALSIGGDLTIGPFPEGTTSGAALRGFYAATGAHVALGGTLLVWAAVCLGVFGVALWARTRDAGVPSVVAGLVLLGAAVETAAELESASFYSFLGRHGADGRIAPAALQAWQLAATEIGTSGGVVLIVLGVAVAAFGYRALPRWIAAAGALIVVAEFTPLSFAASLVFLLWAAVVGVALAVRPERQPAPVAAATIPVG